MARYLVKYPKNSRHRSALSRLGWKPSKFNRGAVIKKARYPMTRGYKRSYRRRVY